MLYQLYKCKKHTKTYMRPKQARNIKTNIYEIIFVCRYCPHLKGYELLKNKK